VSRTTGVGNSHGSAPQSGKALANVRAVKAYWFLPTAGTVPEITDAFLRGEPVRDERLTWPVSFRRSE
jgi:hypothetical protein